MSKRWLLVLGISILLVAIILAAWRSWSNQRDSVAQAQLVVAAQPDFSAEGFQRALPGMELRFPQDFGPHNDYLTEWWYYTGNLESPAGRQFGYQFTVFRRALLPPDQRTERESNWATEQVYLANFALSDVGAGEFYDFERYVRGAAGLAGAQAEPYRVWLYEWEVRQIGDGIYQLHAREQGVEIELNLRDLEGPVLHGDNGYSQKGPDPGNASYYFSQTNLESEGVIRIRGDEYPVTGTSWMDHEFSTSALTGDQVGWDWLSLQLKNEIELMLFEIRQTDGSIDPYSSGTLVGADGSIIHLNKYDFRIEVTDTWESPHTGAVYPAGWIVTIPSQDLVVRITPLQPDQELNLTYTYWEGAVAVNGEYQGEAVSGKGYVELTGYAGSFAGEF